MPLESHYCEICYISTSILLSHYARNRVFMGHMTQLQNCNYKGEVLPEKVFSYMCAYNNLPILKCYGCLTYFWRLSSILKPRSVAVTTLLGNGFSNQCSVHKRVCHLGRIQNVCGPSSLQKLKQRCP
jgi:hypothetical protein